MTPAPKEHRLILRHVDKPGYTPDIECYLRHGGYSTLRKALQLRSAPGPNGRTLSPQEQLRAEVRVSGLRGRGGAGFPTGVKWDFVDRKSGKPIYLVCNGDESEPGTFKDRQIIHKDPHQLLEGLILAAYANDVHLAFIYVRGEFEQGARILETAIEEAKRHGFLGRNILGTGYELEVLVHRGAGAYICGEETGLIESLEGKRPYPRIKPPYFPAAIGLYGCPTIVNNVETLCAVKHVIELGGETYAQLGTPKNTGTRIVCLSGAVNRPGYYEIELGKVTLGELIFDQAFGAGVPGGLKPKAIIPGGVSAPVLRTDERLQLGPRPGSDPEAAHEAARELTPLELPYDFDTLAAAGSMAGSGAIIVIDEETSMVDVLENILEFFAHESCGQCTPCREGVFWLLRLARRVQLGRASAEDVDLLYEVAGNIGGGRTVCAFGDAVAGITRSIVSKFRHEFLERVRRSVPGWNPQPNPAATVGSGS